MTWMLGIWSSVDQSPSWSEATLPAQRAIHSIPRILRIPIGALFWMPARARHNPLVPGSAVLPVLTDLPVAEQLEHGLLGWRVEELLGKLAGAWKATRSNPLGGDSKIVGCMT